MKLGELGNCLKYMLYVLCCEDPLFCAVQIERCPHPVTVDFWGKI